MQPRRGLTLIEVLVAIFILGVGLLAILVLFPLGALNMARALKDDRCGVIAANADAMAQGMRMRSDANVVNAIQMGAVPPPNPGVGPLAGGAFLPPDSNGPSYPVFVDPYYVQGGLATLGGPAGQAPWISRVSPTYITTPQLTDAWFSFLDDLSFDTNGEPTNFTVPGGPLQRQGTYTWAYCYQRTFTSMPSTQQMTVIVYSGRPVQSPQSEPTMAVVAAAPVKSTGLLLSGNAAQTVGPPPLRKGNWLMDLSLTTNATNNPPTGSINGQFYRVMEAVPQGGNTVQVEVYPPLVANNPTTMVLLEYAVEVFARGNNGR
jgi:prepilin-type N-terminal cleavage/methylation domain-containing protein